METQGRATVARAAGLLMASTMLSRVLGYLRDIIIASTYGQTGTTDAYLAAFSIPDFLYNLLVAGTVTAAFIPVFSSYVATDRQEEGWEVASTVYNITMIVMSNAVLAAWVLAPHFIAKLVPGFPPEQMALTVRMTRIMLFQAFFMALNGISMGILNSYQQFLGPAVASVMYNLMIILFGSALHGRLGIRGFSLGVVAGAVTQFLVQVIGLRKVGFRYKPVIRWHHPGVRRIFVLMIPVILSYSLTQTGLFVQQNISSTFPSGSVTALRLAQRLMQMPVSVFGVTMVIAIFPTLTQLAAKDEIAAFKNTFTFGLSSIFYVTIPCSAGLGLLSIPIVRLLYQQGAFNPENTALTARALWYFCLGLFAQSGVLLMNRVFYAMQNTWTPVIVGAGTIVLNIVLNYLFAGWLGIGGLALAYSIAGLVNLCVLLYMVRAKIGSIGGKKLLASFGKICAISALMGLTVSLVAGGFERYMPGMDTKLMQLAQVACATGAGLVVYFGFSILLRMDEMDIVKRMLRRRKEAT